MTPSSMRLLDYLDHMLDAMARCHEYVEDMDEAAFLSDRKTQDAVIRALEVLGEAANNIRKSFPEFLTIHPEIPLGRMVGMRNVLSHGYFLVDLESVWNVIQSDLPPLHVSIRSLRDGITSA
jgi:uncharacterized protein with HEPN domain